MAKKGSSSARHIAPRLASGDKRIRSSRAFPPKVDAAIRAIAAHERKSMNWVMEEVVIDYFSMPRPKYVEPKKKE